MHRIAALFEYPTLLGGERSLLASIERLRGRFEFTAIAPKEGDLGSALRELGVTTVSTPLLDENGDRVERSHAASRLVEVVQDSGADLLHANSLAMGRRTGAIAARLPVPCTAHLRDIIGLSAAAISDLNGNAKLSAVSQATRDFHVAQGVDGERTAVVYTGVDLERFRARERAPVLRCVLRIPKDSPMVLVVGQIGLRKGWDVLAEAAVHLAKAWPNLHVVLVGERFGSKAETVAYELRVRETLLAALPGRVLFLGSRDDVPELMAAADLLVHPARQEPFGRVLPEAAASGLPIVATDVGGTREMLEEGVSARLVPPGDAAALALVVSRVLSNSAERRLLGLAARERVARLFSAEVAAERLAREWERELLSTDSNG